MTTPPPPEKMRPVISIITSTFNAAEHFEDLITSMRAQDRTGIEWIVVDGASKDNTVALANSARDVIDVFISEPDQGLYEAWNKGVALAKGTWIAFIGADDYYLPGALTTLRKAALDCTSDINLIVGSVHWTDETNKYIVREVARPWNWQKMQKWMLIGHQATLHHRSLFQQFGAFDTSLRSAADYDFFLRVGQNVQAIFIDSVLARIRVGGISKQPEAIKETQLVRQRNLDISPLNLKLSYSIARFKLFIRSGIDWLKSKWPQIS